MGLSCGRGHQTPVHRSPSSQGHRRSATARDNVAHGHWPGAVNGAYYAVFHTASAALLQLDIERARHAGVQAAFGAFLVRPGRIEPEFGQIYNRVRQAREMQDYDVTAVALPAKKRSAW